MWNCPKCHEEVEDEFDVCWQCGTTLEGIEDRTFQTADEVGPIDDPALDFDRISLTDDALSELPEAHEDLIECFEARDTIEAKFIADQLRSVGIPAVADRRNGNHSLGAWIPSMWGYGPRVRVRRSDLDRAVTWLAEFEKRRRSRAGADD